MRGNSGGITRKVKSIFDTPHRSSVLGSVMSLCYLAG